MIKPEIMAPAGNFAMLRTAIQSGAGSVYFGVGDLNMRSGSANFRYDDLEEIASICNENNVKSYLTLNIVVYDEELSKVKEILDRAKEAGVSAVIASDFSVINYAQEIGLEVHLSTQSNVSNISAVKFYSKFADVVVLARELRLEQIKYICEEIKKQDIRGPLGELVKVELFVHGALCVAISGKCYMSINQYNCSANRGKCLQACRREYKVTDLETGDELVVDNKFVMSPSDLCTIEILDKIISAGVSILKIEGRGRSPEYVDTVVRVYSKAIDKIVDGSFNRDWAKEQISELETVFNRGFWNGGYYMGEKVGEWSGLYGSKTTKKKKTVGIVTNYYKNPKIVEFDVTSKIEIKKGDEILIIGPTSGLVKITLDEMRVNDSNSESASKGDNVTLPLDKIVRKNDEVFLVSYE